GLPLREGDARRRGRVLQVLRPRGTWRAGVPVRRSREGGGGVGGVPRARRGRSRRARAAPSVRRVGAAERSTAPRTRGVNHVRAPLSIPVERLRAAWLERQGLGSAPAKDSLDAVRRGGWLHTAGGGGPYLSVRARLARFRREDL